jgi:hypothetical protein
MSYKLNLKDEVGSLDMLINALSSELRDTAGEQRAGEPDALLMEMQEALLQLRQARSLRKIWLSALEEQGDVDVMEASSRPAYESGLSSAF